MSRFKSKKPRVVSPPSAPAETAPAARQGPSPTGSNDSNEQGSSEGSRRISPGTLRQRVIQEIKRGGSAVRRGFANIGTRTPSASVIGTGEQQSFPPSPSHQAAPTPDTASDQLAPLPVTPKKTLRSKMSFGRLPKTGSKRAASEAMSDSEGSLSGGSRATSSAGTPAVRLTDFGPIKNTAAISGAGGQEVLSTPPGTPRGWMAFPPSEAPSPTPASRPNPDRAEPAAAARVGYPTGHVAMPDYPLTPPDSNKSYEATPSPPMMAQLASVAATQPSRSSHQHVLTDDELQAIMDGHRKLANLFAGVKEEAQWVPTIHTIAAKYNSAFHRHMDCSFLVDAAAPGSEVIQASEPLEGSLRLERVRDSFLKMAPGVAEHAEYYATRRNGPHKASWNLPPEAKTHPRRFWERIWNSFDFEATPYIDTTLTLEEQHPDVHMYLAALGFWSEEPPERPTLRAYLGYRPSQERNEVSYEVRYDMGCEFLENVLKYNHGIYLTPTDSEPAEPFSWLDCRLSRLQSLKWEFYEEPDDEGLSLCWRVDHHDYNHDDFLQPAFDGDHFAAYSHQRLFLTNVRVPLPRRVLKHRTTLERAIGDLFHRHHPLQMLGEARTLVGQLNGDENDDYDLKAAMLYLVISRLAKGNLSFFPLLLDESLNDDEDEANIDLKWSKHSPEAPLINGED